VLTDRLIAADGAETLWQHHASTPAHTHGTGCTLASAIATGLAQGMALVGCASPAPAPMSAPRSWRAPGFGQGHGPMGFPVEPPHGEICQPAPPPNHPTG
jgi:hydroxymethylpyrimidine/phosphomethylpyrimidine kinase